MSTETAQKFLPADLPKHFADVQQGLFVLNQLAGLLQLERLDDASKAAIESAYDRALHETGMYRNDEMGCLYFDSGLQTFTGRRIYIGLHRQDDGWKLDSILRRKLLPSEPEEYDASMLISAAGLTKLLALLDWLEEPFSTWKPQNLSASDRDNHNDILSSVFDDLLSRPTLLRQSLEANPSIRADMLKTLEHMNASMQALYLDTDGVERLIQLVQGVSRPADSDEPVGELLLPAPEEDDAPDKGDPTA